MALRLHNTLTRSVDPFEPLEPGRAGVYACGPTVYGTAHIGNFRSFVFYDVVHRFLEWKGLRVRFVMNLTDVDDKTIRAARERGMGLREYTEPYAKTFLEESDALGILRADLYPRATDYVGEMISLVETLLDRGLAYPTSDGSVFFDISAFPEYGKLARKDLERGLPGERVADDEYGKEDVRDFALWKGAKPEDEEVGAVWDAPWGRGRPGWHLECSAMSLAEVGETLDLHLGGEDLIFPHHEDEIAQSEGATGKPFARYWLHVKHLRVEGEKMSKSRGNVRTVGELLLEGIDPAAIRHQLLSAHYRSDLNFTRDGLAASERAVSRILDFEARLEDHPTAEGTRDPELEAAAARALERFEAALDDDLNVPDAMGALFVLVNEANGLLDRRREGVAAGARERVVKALDSMDRVLGLLEVGRSGREADPELAGWVEERIAARARARSDRRWEEADAIRDELAEAGVILEDSSEGTRWKRARQAG